MCDRIGGSQRVKPVVVFQLLRANPEQCRRRCTNVTPGSREGQNLLPTPTRLRSVFSTIRTFPRCPSSVGDPTNGRPATLSDAALPMPSMIGLEIAHLMRARAASISTLTRWRIYAGGVPGFWEARDHRAARAPTGALPHVEVFAAEVGDSPTRAGRIDKRPRQGLSRRSGALLAPR